MTTTTIELTLPEGTPADIYASGRVIQHPRFRALHGRISECLQATAEDGEPQCLCLIGETGVGKTTLARSYAAAFPRYEMPLGTRTPILYLETPHPITVKGMTSALLHALGDPRAFKGTQPEMNARLQSFLADCGTRLVILDDFHHLIDKQTNRILRHVSEWLKVLIKNTGITYLVVGIEGEVERILTANPQLSRLFIRERLRPFPWQQNRPETVTDFARLITYVQATLQFELSEEEPLPVLLFRIHQATGGVMSYIMNLFRQAKRIQQRQGLNDQPLTLATLADAYTERLQSHIGRNNPFLSTAKNQVETAE